jgi:hypothetical protein
VVIPLVVTVTSMYALSLDPALIRWILDVKVAAGLSGPVMSFCRFAMYFVPFALVPSLWMLTWWDSVPSFSTFDTT